MKEVSTQNGLLNSEGRRNFFRNFLACTVSFIEEINGRPQMSLDELDKLPDEIVRHMIPMHNQRHSCRVEGDILLLDGQKELAAIKICDLDEIRLFVWHCMDGSNDIENISRKIEEKFGLGYDQAYNQVKSFFVFLAKRLICYPAYAHEKVERGGNV